MMSIAFAIDVESTGVSGPGRAWKINSTPPWRSRPRRVFFAFTTPGMPAVTISDTSTRAMTKTRTKLLRARSLMANGEGSARRGEHEQEAAVVVVGREEVRGGPRGQVRFGAQHGGLAQRAHPPLEHGRDVVLVVVETQVQGLGDRLAEHLLLVVARQLEGAPPTADDPALAVGHEERGVGRRVVVVE